MTLTPPQFVAQWQNTTLGERQSYQLHFLDVCQLVGHEAPGGEGRDSQGKTFAFEYGVKKDGGGQGFADVFYDGHFAIEYKAAGKYKDLAEAYQQLLQYRERLNNPPLLVVTDIATWEIHTNFPNTEKKVYRFTHADIANRPSILKLLTDLFTAPERLHPDRNTAQVTTDAAEVFRVIADDMRAEQSAPAERIAHFLTKLVFCLFAEDVSLLPAAANSSKGIFAEIIERTYREPSRFIRYAQELFEAMASGGEVMFQKIPYLNGSLFDDVTVEAISPEALGRLSSAAQLNWESVEPAIFGTLFERSLDPGKRAQLGAHYTSREDILLIVEPVLMQPLRRDWDALCQQAEPLRAQLDTATTPRDRIQLSQKLEALRQPLLTRLREIKVLDPACGSGNFLYVALQLLMDMEKAVIHHPLFAGLTLPMPEVHPRQMYGIEINPIAHDLASIVVWIGYIQWRQNNGYATLTHREPILESLRDNIRQMDAIMTVTTTPDPSYTSPPNPLSAHGEGEAEGAERAYWKTPPELWEKLKPLARQMRHDSTPAEDQLWQALRNRQLDGYKFRRQHSIDRFIADFYCHDARLIVEVDGPIHQYTPDEDALRQEFLESRGLRVLRFRNAEVINNLDNILAQIGAALGSPSPNAAQPHPHLPTLGSPSPRAERGLGGAATEPDWPAVDVIVGNPPFLGDKKMRGELGDAYVDTLRSLYQGRVPGGADLVCYWFEKARAHIAAGKARRAGLLATNSIRGGANREVLKRIKDSGDIFMAWSDREWVLDGAAVRVSMVGFDDRSDKDRRLNGLVAKDINADLTGRENILMSKNLEENRNMSFIGVSQHGPFEIAFEIAQQMINASPSNAKVVKPIVNALEITRIAENRMVIDFEPGTSLEEAQKYSLPFEYVQRVVFPIRAKNNRPQYREYWWIHGESRPAMRLAIGKLPRFIVTPRVAKHRVFVWMTPDKLPSDATVAIARDDDYFFGVLHSRLHEVWSLRMGTSLEDRPRYTPTTTFETFPFPWPPGSEDSAHPAYQAVAAAARQLHQERQAWLDQKGKDRTLTNLYNALAVWRGKDKMRTKPDAADFAPHLADLHDALDRAVCDAYGWPHDILNDDEAILRRLLDLNLQRAG